MACVGMLQIAACGGGDGAFDDPIAGNQQNIEDSCNKAFECMDTFPADFPVPFEFLFGNSAAECVDALLPPPEVEQAVRDAIDAGRTIYDPDAARQCNDAMLATACDEFWTAEEPAVCDQIVMGTLANGEACVIGVECVTQFCGNQGVCEDEPQF